MKTLQTIGGIALFIIATISFIDVSEGQSGAGLWGMITFYAIMILISGTLVFFGTRKPKEERTRDREQKVVIDENKKYDSKIKSLTELKDKEILTEEEYNQKIKNLENSKLKTQLKLSGDYKKLKKLYDEGVLTKQEFESKIDIIRLKNRKINNETLKPKIVEKTHQPPEQEIKRPQNIFSNIDSKLVKLKKLKSIGVLTQEEYDEKFKQLNNSKIEFNFKKSEDYLDLKLLHTQGVLTEDEFNSKSEILLKFYKEKLINESKYWNRNTISIKIILFIFIIIYPFIINFIYQKYFPSNHYNSDWSTVYWLITTVTFVILIKHKYLLPAIVLLWISYSFLVNSTINI